MLGFGGAFYLREKGPSKLTLMFACFFVFLLSKIYTLVQCPG